MSARVLSSTLPRTVAALLALLLVAGALALAAPAARADSAPLNPANPATPLTVTADALPTVQLGKAADGKDGVAWAQVVVGNTVYVAGRFVTARPAGAAPGAQEVPRRNLLAYDIRTGQLVTSFAPDLNGQALAIAASPDGTRIYVGGDFTAANGQPRNRVAAYDTRSGALVPDWRPSVSGQVRALAATGSAVYIGGTISAVGSASRTRLAAVSAVNGALLPWAPVPGVGPTSGNRLPIWENQATLTPKRDAQGRDILDTAANSRTSNDVQALVIAGGSVIAAGRFDSLNGVRATGIGALDPVTGATRPFAVNQLITNQGVHSAVWSLSTDGRAVYGTAYDFYGPGNMESAFAAEATTGALLWASTCRGDTYSSFPLGGALYTGSHVHECGNIGSYAEFSPKVLRYAAAFSTAATGVNGPFTFGNANFARKPAPALLSWWPILAAGAATGQSQAAWSVAGNDRYVVYAGEFPRVNSTPQQGLVRFAVPGTAPSRMAPTGAGLTPTVTSPAPGTARVVWQESHDPDNEVLTYRVYRDNGTVPVHEVSAAQTWWDRDLMSFTDRGLTAGAHTYRVTVTDPQGNRNTRPWTSATVAAGSTPARSYVETVRIDGAESLWSLGERSGAVLDRAGGYDLTVSGGVTRGQPGAVPGDADAAMAFDGRSGLAATTVQTPAPQVFSVEAWVNTRSTAGGVLLEFGNTNTGLAPVHDRMLSIDPSGRLRFGIWQNAHAVVTSPGSYNDGRWHHVVGTFRPGAMTLYVDGVQVAAGDAVMAEPLHGYWRVGAGVTWVSGASSWFSGLLDEVAVYPSVLSAGQVANHFAAGSTGRPANTAPVAAFTSTASGLTASVDAAGSTDADGRVTAFAWTFGDGGTATGPAAVHTYAAAGTYPVTLTVTDDDGATASRTQTVTVTAPPPNAPPTAAFTAATVGRTATFDGTSSQEPGGAVRTWAWDFGDGGTGTGARVTRDYAADGVYTVRLTVTDDDGETATTTREVTVAPQQGGAVIADDAFDRTVTGGLGTADVGGPWTASVGAARQSVGGGMAVLDLPTAGSNTAAHLGGVAQAAVDVRTSFTLGATPSGAGTYVYVSGRRVSATEDYRVRVRVQPDGRIGLALSRVTGGTETFPGGEVLVPGVTWAPGQTVSVRVQVSGAGTAQVLGTVWTGGTEPAPQLVRSDTTPALQAPGALGLAVHRPGSSTVAGAVRFASFTARAPGTVPPPPANAAPTAAFTTAVTGLSLGVDGRASSDSDGTVASHRWEFGDGATAQGATATHTYAAPGTYPVTLTVTDDDGATHVAVQQVTVTAPQQEQPPPAPGTLAQDGFDRTVSGGLGTAEVGGAWTASSGAARQSVTGSAAEMALPTAGANTAAHLAGVSSTAADVRTSFTLGSAPTGAGTYVYVTGRRVATGEEYRVRVRVQADGRIGLALSRLTGGAETFPSGELLLSGITWTPGTVVNVRVVAAGTGTTEVRASVWAEGQAEPAAAQLVRTDTTPALQAPGSVGLAVHRPGSSTAATTVRFPGITVTSVG